MKLDHIDLKILAVLQREGRATKSHVADLVGLSVSPCHERIKRLEEAGYIRGYHAEIDIEKLARSQLIIVEICLKSHDTADFERFRRNITDVPEVLECYQTSGVIDFILKVVAPSVEDYQRLMDRLLEANIGIGRFNTCVVTKPVKRYGPYPLNLLAPAN